MAPPDLSSAILGTWSLLSCEHKVLRTGKVESPFGPASLGRLSYLSNGQMSVLISRTDRPAPTTPNIFELTTDEKIGLAGGFLSYAGRYRLSGDSVIHEIEACYFPNWIGSSHSRKVALVDGRLVLSTEPFPSAEGDQVATLVWERI